MDVNCSFPTVTLRGEFGDLNPASRRGLPHREVKVTDWASSRAHVWLQGRSPGPSLCASTVPRCITASIKALAEILWGWRRVEGCTTAPVSTCQMPRPGNLHWGRGSQAQASYMSTDWHVVAGPGRQSPTRAATHPTPTSHPPLKPVPGGTAPQIVALRQGEQLCGWLFTESRSMATPEAELHPPQSACVEARTPRAPECDCA